MSKRDYYEVLGLSRGASGSEIKKAYRSQAKKLHPDSNKDDPSAEAAFKEVNEAYEVLRDPEKKAAYDSYGHAAFEGGGGGGGGFQHGDFNFGFSDISDAFESFFGGGGRRESRRANRGSDVRHDLAITLKEAYEGVKKTIFVTASSTCGECGGSGAAKGTQPETCGTCNGMGKVRAQQGFFAIERTCPSCGGRRQIVRNPCRSCAGAGRKLEDRSIEVDIPKGVDSGNRMRLSGQGEAGEQGGPPGDLYVFITVKGHSLFRRDGPSVYCSVPISMVDAALGCEIEVPTIDGRRGRVKIPAGSQSGVQLRLAGKGMPSLRGDSHPSGDMMIEVVVETPVNLTEEQRSLLERFREEKADNSPRNKTFLDKVRSFWESFGS